MEHPKGSRMSAPPKHTPADLQQLALSLAPHVNDALNPERQATGQSTIGFVLCVFELGAADMPMSFVSNTTNDDLKQAIATLHHSVDRIGSRNVVVSKVDGELRVDSIHPAKKGEPS